MVAARKTALVQHDTQTGGPLGNLALGRVDLCRSGLVRLCHQKGAIGMGEGGASVVHGVQGGQIKQYQIPDWQPR